MRRRYMSLCIDAEYVWRWQIGLDGIALAVRSEMRRCGISSWPQLVHAEQVNSVLWKLIFAWPEEWEGLS